MVLPHLMSSTETGSLEKKVRNHDEHRPAVFLVGLATHTVRDVEEKRSHRRGSRKNTKGSTHPSTSTGHRKHPRILRDHVRRPSLRSSPSLRRCHHRRRRHLPTHPPVSLPHCRGASRRCPAALGSGVLPTGCRASAQAHYPTSSSSYPLPPFTIPHFAHSSESNLHPANPAYLPPPSPRPIYGA